MVVNVFCQNKGWLFEDLKHHMARHGAVASDTPLHDADAWICLRDTEAHTIPDRRRAVVQCHHMNDFDHVDYGMISFCHPAQERKFRGLHGRAPKSFTLPIGSRDIPYSPLPQRPVLGFFCREVGLDRRLKGSDTFAAAVTLARQVMDFDVLMIGERLDHIAHLGTYECRAAVPDDYARITALAVTSTSICVPLSMYEALAAGRAVVSTPREMTFPARNLLFGEDARDLAAAFTCALSVKVTDRQMPYSRDDWARRQVQEAMALCA